MASQHWCGPALHRIAGIFIGRLISWWCAWTLCHATAGAKRFGMCDRGCAFCWDCQYVASADHVLGEWPRRKRAVHIYALWRFRNCIILLAMMHDASCSVMVQPLNQKSRTDHVTGLLHWAICRCSLLSDSWRHPLLFVVVDLNGWHDIIQRISQGHRGRRELHGWAQVGSFC